MEILITILARIRTRSKKLGRLFQAMAFLWICVSCSVRTLAADKVTPEAEVKAAYLINFAKYADWPAGAFAQTNSPIIISVLGDSKVSEEVQKVITGRVINGREVELKKATNLEEAGTCHILFISTVEQQKSPNILEKVKGNILTVGESASFLEEGGVINLARKDQKIALEVNLAAAEKAQIKISSKLLSVAKVVKGK